MTTFTYRMRVLIPRGRLPHTDRDQPHIIDPPSFGPIELHVEQGTGNRPDHLTLIKRGFAGSDHALDCALAAKRALMRTGLIANVPILFGNDESSTTLAQHLVDQTLDETGFTLRPDVHGIDIIDEAAGPAVMFRVEAEGRVGVPINQFLDNLTDSLTTHQPGFVLHDRLSLAVEVFMAASTEQGPPAPASLNS